MLKRFLLFQYAAYYPSGGSDDVTGSFDTMEELEAFIAEQQYTYEYTDILDLEKREWVKT